jgi:translocation and assembly module TamB
LGQNLRLRGQGVDTLVRGDLALTSPGGRLALNGTVRTHQGLYAAYGQKLEITRGDFIFSGAPGNPRLDVLAVRPNLDVLVGVSIAGSASNPRIRLYSEPDMAEYDKLSWLVLGRASEGLGTTDAALLQRAAFALLSGNSAGPTDQMLSALGLTEFSVKQTEGDTRDTVVSLGKQLSRRWWVGYERGVHATTGTWQVIYRVAQRFTLRAQSGEQNALDVIWTWRW